MVTYSKSLYIRLHILKIHTMQSLFLYFVTKNQRTRMACSPKVIYKLEFVWKSFVTIYAQHIQAVLLWIDCTLDSDIRHLLKKLFVNKWHDPLLSKHVIALVHTIPHQTFFSEGSEWLLWIVNYRHGQNHGKGCHLCNGKWFYNHVRGHSKGSHRHCNHTGVTLTACLGIVTVARCPSEIRRLCCFKLDQPNKTILGGCGFFF